MRFRTTLIAALLLALFAAYFYFFEHKKTQEKEAADERAKKVFSVDWDKMKGLRIVNAHGSFLMEKSGAAGDEAKTPAGQGNWRVLEPVHAEADASTLNTIVSSLKDLKVERIVSEAPEDLAPFGLKEPVLEVEVLMPEGEQPPPLLVGGKSPVGFNSYAMRRGQEEVLLLSTSLDAQLDKKLIDLRERRLFTFAKDSVESMRVMRRGRPRFEVVKEKDKWKLAFPLRALASEEEVDKILNKLTALRAESFEAEQTKDLSPYGLFSPEWAVEMSLTPDHARSSLLLGKAATENGKEVVYAKRGEIPAVVSLTKDLIASLEITPDQLRERRVFPFRSWEAGKVELTSKGEIITVAKEEGGKWRMESPVEAKAAGNKISPFLSMLSRLEGTEFFPAPSDEQGLVRFGLSPPLIRVAIYRDQGEQEDQTPDDLKQQLIGTVLFGSQEKETSSYYAMVAGGDSIARVGKDVLEKDLPEQAEDWRDKKFLDFSPYRTASVRYRGPEGTLLMEKKQSGWQLKQPGDHEVEEGEVEDLLSTLNELETVHFLAPSAAEGGQKATMGLEPPAMTIILKDEEDKEIGQLLISDRGPAAERGLVYAMNGEEGWTGLIREETKKQLSEKLGALIRKNG